MTHKQTKQKSTRRLCSAGCPRSGPGSGALPKAFTLIEMLITISIFMIFMGIVANTFLIVTNSQRHTNAIRKMAAEVRLLEETLSQRIANGRIDYDCYERDPACLDQQGLEKKTLLAVIDATGQKRALIRFRKDEGNVTVEEQKRLGRNWVPQDEHALMADTEVAHLSFFITLQRDPASDLLNDDIQFQPKISMFLTTLPKNVKRAPRPFHFQSTLSARNL